MLDLRRGEATVPICIHIAFTQHKIVIVNLSTERRGREKVKNISKRWYLSEINFANCSRWSNLLIPQNEGKLKKKYITKTKAREKCKRLKITMWISHTRSDMLWQCLSFPFARDVFNIFFFAALSLWFTWTINYHDSDHVVLARSLFSLSPQMCTY